VSSVPRSLPAPAEGSLPRHVLVAAHPVPVPAASALEQAGACPWPVVSIVAGDRIRGWVRSPLVIFPVLALVVMATLVLFNLNGSSVALLGVNYHHDSHLLHGEPRGIRSDEAALSTPALVGNTRRGLPTTPWIGLTATFLPATSIGVPSNHWSELFKPQDWGVFVLGVSRGFAWHWWSQVIAAVLGTFALLFTVTRRRWTSAALATVAALSPYVAWWSLTPGLALGFSTGAAAAMISALRSRSTRGRWLSPAWPGSWGRPRSCSCTRRGR